MKRRRIMKRISFIMTFMLCFSFILSSFHPKNKIYADQTLSDGTYTIKGFLRSASSDQASMGNAGIIQPMQLLVKDGTYTIRMECKALSTKLGSMSFKGYLAEIGYFKDWEKESEPKDQKAQALKVESYYQNVYDSYNDPKKGTDARVKGKLYPHYLHLPVEYEKKQIWVQVYVPVMEAINKGSGLQYARLQLDWSTVKKVSDKLPDMNTTDDNKNTQNKTTEKKATTTTVKKTTTKTKNLNIKKLKDGTYAISGKMLKTDKKSESMSNKAINHTIKLTVRSGKYYLNLDFKGIDISSQYGYLSKIKYYTSGYKTDKYHAPTGKVKSVTINSYQKDTKGKKIKDNYGSNYPDKVTFPLIKEALTNGYVPLQFYVPIMEAISPGSGTQSAYLKLDLHSIKEVKSESVFKEKEKQNTKTTAESTSSSKASFQMATAEDTPSEATTKSETTTQTIQGSDQMIANETGTQKASTWKAQDESEEENDSSPIVVPSIMSGFLTLAGVFYKLKSRGL